MFKNRVYININTFKAIDYLLSMDTILSLQGKSVENKSWLTVFNIHDTPHQNDFPLIKIISQTKYDPLSIIDKYQFDCNLNTLFTNSISFNGFINT
jgi:hypothetical protein